RRATSMLAARGVNVSGVAVDDKAATGKVRVTFTEGEPHFSIEEGVAWDKIDPSPAIVAAIRSADVFCFSTLAQRTPLMRKRLRQILKEIRQSGHFPPFGGKRGRAPLCLLDLNLRPPFTSKRAILETLHCAD